MNKFKRYMRGYIRGKSAWLNFLRLENFAHQDENNPARHKYHTPFAVML